MRQKPLKKSTIFFHLFICLTIQVFGQNDAITKVNFDLMHSLRIPNHHVTVDLQKNHDSVTVHITSVPTFKSREWNSTKRDYSFKTTIADFDKVINSIKSINSSDILSNSGSAGFDGTTCQIQFGGSGASIMYSVWTPNANTKERNLQPFLNACRLILQTAKLDPGEIL